ncbi:MAG: 4-hydroxy-3-methylbut-2-enyl diphosphate reductase [Elusimicrobia bacterium]|nr:4-hydroxy-3-methylbut-2-enyl diphosphate reductase [Elusimicrobiota bacterium]
MKIIVAKNSGFCFGVRRAIELASNFSKKTGDVYTLGPIIHNSQVVKKLEESGIGVIRNLKEIKKGSNIIIRAHGIPRKTLEELKRKKVGILDATCPYVKRSKKHIEELAKEGYRIVIIGNPYHPEIKYIVSYAPKDSVILKTISDVRKMKYFKKLGIITQTTQSLENFVEITSGLLKYSDEFKIFNTICPDAINRQNETVKLAGKSDVMIVIGGKNSANTKRLFAISKKIQPDTYHIETTGELRDSWLRKANIVGVVAGASTPDWIIKEFIDAVKNKRKKYSIY